MSDDFIYCRTQTDFVDSILDTVKQHDGYLLDELLNVTRMYQVEDLDFSQTYEPNVDQQLPNDHDQLWKILSQHHWNVCRYLILNDIDRAFRHQSKKFACFVNILNIYSNRLAASTTDDEHELGQISHDDDLSWLLPVFNRHLHELRLLALLGNDESTNDDTETTDVNNSNSTIQTLNTQLSQTAISAIQRFSSSNKLRKLGIFIIVNQMLKTYYALHKFNLCIYAISKADRPLKQYMQEELNHQQDRHFSSYVITYRYFLGKHLLLKHDYTSAISHFDYVFTNCLDSNKSRSIKNKQQALLYLVVLKMLHGSTPKMDLLEKYQLNQLIDLIEPIRLGSLKLFFTKLRQYEQFLFDTGLFFLVENFKLIIIRNLLRMYISQIDQQQTDRIPLDTTLILINFEEEYFTLNEIIDILNNMIDKGMIKGYISYKHRTLVMSKKDPFPKHFRFTSLLNTS